MADLTAAFALGHSQTNRRSALVSFGSVSPHGICGGREVSVPGLTICLLPSQTVKGGISETRIEKRIVISGDTDIDHDQVCTRRV